MGFDRDNPHKWFTAGEGALIAQALQVPGVPWTREGMTKLFKRLAADDPYDHASLSRRRTGQKGGGGKEFYWSYFPEALWDELDAEVGHRERAARLSHTASASGMVSLSPDDERLMQAMAQDIYGHIDRFEPIIRRRVRRSWVVGRAFRYRSWELDRFDRQNVLVVLPAMPDPRPAFLWKCEPKSKLLTAHGEDGFIGMTAPGWLWIPGTRPRRNVKE